MKEIYEGKISQAFDYLKQKDIDGWLVYTSESSDPCLSLIPGVATVGPGIFLFTKEREAYAICNSIDAQDIEESRLFTEVIKYPVSLEKSLQLLIKQLNPKKIALNYSEEEPLADGLTTGRYRWVRRVLDEVVSVEFESAERLLTKLRSIKTPKEIEQIQKAITITLDIYEEVFLQLRAGMTEQEAAQFFVEGMNKRGVVNGVDRTPSWPIVMKENIAHRPPGTVVIEKGDLVIFDFSVEFNGYVSDIARTVYFLKDGEVEPPQHIQETFSIIHKAISSAKEGMLPGRQGFEIDEIARSLYTDHGYPEITHATGHQIGRDVHDGGVLLGPRWERYGQAPYGQLEAGMVFTIEPTIFMDNGVHFIVEENVLITEEGAEWLSHRQEECICIPVGVGT